MTNKKQQQNSTAQAVNKWADNLLFIKLSSNKLPEFKEIKTKRWICFGKKNDYPNYLLRIYNQSAKHNAIINQKAAYILGQGLGDAGKFVINSDAEALNDVTRKIIIDLELFGGFAVEIIWNMLGTEVSEIRHVDFSNIRTDKNNETFFYTKKWYKELDDGSIYMNNRPEAETDFREFPAFNPAIKTGSQIYYFKQYRPGLQTYPLPEYIGAISYIELDYQIANYWYNAVKFGFTASHIINFYNGVPSLDEQKELEKIITDKFTGTNNAGRFILNFTGNKETGGSDVVNIQPQDLDKQFNILNTTVQQEIFSGHRITSPMLFGIKEAGQLGGRNELIEANELFQNNYVTPKQILIQNAFKDFLPFMGIDKDLSLLKITPISLDLLNSANGFNLLTDDEKREAIGKTPLPKKETIQGTQTVNALNTVSPLVATKILSNMTTNEIRAIAGLTPVPGGDSIKEEISNFKFHSEIDEIKLLKLFRSKGRKREGKLIDARFLEFEDIENLSQQEQKFADLRSTELSILDLLNKDNLMPASEIAKVLGSSEQRINNIITSLKDKELIKVKQIISGDEKIISLTPVANAINILKKTEVATEKIFVAYSYEWRPGFSDADADTSREFCIEMMAESKRRKAEGRLWSRQDIESISSATGWNVWEMRGGWYTKSNSDIHLPYCRHIWVQNLIKI